MMKNDKIIISGPPGSGKTKIIDTLKAKGYIVHEELHPGEITEETNKLNLSELVFNGRIKHYHKSSFPKRKKLNKKQSNQFIFFDRSIIDVIAYMDFWGEEYPLSWGETVKKCRYSKNIFYTPNWKEIYKQTTQRPETYEEAKKIDLFLKKAFLRFNYNIIEIPKLAINARVEFILKNI